jgi:hypothetical protein
LVSKKFLQWSWVFQIGGGIAGDFPICGSNVVPRYGNAETPFGVISAKFQILPQVTVLILGQCQMKNYLG